MLGGGFEGGFVGDIEERFILSDGRLGLNARGGLGRRLRGAGGRCLLGGGCEDGFVGDIEERFILSDEWQAVT
jgi:hypothetical protein